MSIANHLLFDTIRGTSQNLSSNTVGAAQGSLYDEITAYNNNGFSLGSDTAHYESNRFGESYVSWTFRKAPKFFDVVYYVGDGTNRLISHNLGVSPGVVVIKALDSSSAWSVWHRSSPNPSANTHAARLDSTIPYTYTGSGEWGNSEVGTNLWGSCTFSSTHFSVGDNNTFIGTASTNYSGRGYVAYLFAHDPSEDGLIQCGITTQNADRSWPVVDLGWEPQWMLVKSTNGNGTGYQGWTLWDSMRGIDKLLQSHTSEPDVNYSGQNINGIQSVGFSLAGGYYSPIPATAIYVAIRRPNKPPESGSEVFGSSVCSPSCTVNTNYPVDLAIVRPRVNAQNNNFFDRLRGNYKFLSSDTASSETDAVNSVIIAGRQSGIDIGMFYHGAGSTSVNYFRRAPGFFDIVCYTGNQISDREIKHSLSVVPQLIIVKSRNAPGGWSVYTNIADTGFMRLSLNTTSSGGNETPYNISTGTDLTRRPTTSSLFIGADTRVNWPSSTTYVAYLFATLPGISKVGSYTGNGGSQTINCGFTTGARFVLVKRTDSTGDWLVVDTARGVIDGADPTLRLNSTAAEFAEDWVDYNAYGFSVNQTATANANVNGSQYIYLAVA
jgi:hypothetical protein